MATYDYPRPVAAAAVVHGLASAQRVIVVLGLVFAAGTIAEIMVSRGNGGYATLVAAPVLAVWLLALVLWSRPSLLTAVLFLLGGAVSSVAVVALGLSVDPGFAEPGSFALNRPATALVLVGALRGSALSGMAWSVAGLGTAYSSLAVGLAVSGSSASPGWGPLIVFSVSFLAYSTLAITQRAARLSAPQLRHALASLERSERKRALELRAAAVVHDTVLADLAVVASTSGPIDQRTQRRFLADLDFVRASSVHEVRSGAAPPTAFGSALLELAHDFQWTGVRVDVSGAELVPSTVRGDVADALLAAARAALDNMARHSGADHTDLVVGARDGIVSVLIVDDGHGFDPEAVTSDRLGLRTAIRGRVESVGGSVRVWSGEDGTTIMLSAPMREDAP